MYIFTVKALYITLNVRANFIIDAPKERKVVFMGFPSLCFES